MGIWAEIKHALNSTLGTNKFKPLDQLIRYDGKQLAIADTTYMSLPMENEKVSGEYTSGGSKKTEIVNVCSFVPKVNGSMRLYTTMTVYNDKATGTGAYPAYGYIYVSVNGVKQTTLTVKNNSEQQYYTANTAGVVHFTKGDVIRLSLQAEIIGTTVNWKYHAEIDQLLIQARVIDNLIEVE